MAIELTIPITATPSEPISFEALEKMYELMRKKTEGHSDRWHYVKATVDIDDWIPEGTVVLAKEATQRVLVMKETGTHCRVLTPTLANVMLKPIDFSQEYSFVDIEQNEAFDLQWQAVRQLTTLVANENAEAASKHLKPLSFT